MTGIRSMEERDLCAIETLINQLAEDLGETFSLDKKQSEAHYHAMKQYPDIYQNYVYCIDDVVVGFLSLLLYRSFFHKKGTALINEVIVRKEYRGQSIGKDLVAHAMAEAQKQGMDEIDVGVMKENTRSLSFYRRNGFDEEYLLLGKEYS